jgi:hypothetical protein
MILIIKICLIMLIMNKPYRELEWFFWLRVGVRHSEEISEMTMMMLIPAAAFAVVCRSGAAW